MKVKINFKPSEFHIKAKFKFDCEGCDRGWNSANGTNIFYYQVTKVEDDEGNLKGCEIKFKVDVYSQKCVKCKENATVSFYENEGDEKVRVGEEFVNEMLIDLGLEERIQKERKERGSKMRKKHDKANCGACSAGVCRSNKSSKKKIIGSDGVKVRRT